MGTIDEKDEAAKRGHAMSARERAVTARESALHRREQASAAEELAVGDRQVSLQTREEVLQLREDLVRAREEAALARAEHDQALHDLKEANEKLILASIRSQELAEVAEDARRQLELSERELREVAGFRERLIGIVGHDLRNPLSAIWVAVDLLCSGTISSSESEKLLHRVRTSTRRMGTMIEQLLDFTRAHVGGGLPVELKPTDLGEVCRRIVDELELGHAAENRFVCEFEGDLHGTWDPERMAQLISNLGGNAIAHGLADAPVHVRARADGEFVVLEIANLGTPIPSELLPVLFDPFSRARPKEKSVGLGLGLYISREIVVAHGGTIAVTSNADATTFAVRLPRHPSATTTLHI